MKVTIKKLPMPEEYQGRYDPCDITWFGPKAELEGKWKDESAWEEFGIVALEIEYWYGVGSYEGAGSATMKATLNSGDVVRAEFDLGHCSCYGPLDDVNPGYLS